MLEKAMAEQSEGPRRGGEEQELPSHGEGRRITAQQIREALMDEGYSASRGTSWVREVLTSVQNDENWQDEGEKARLVAEIQAILDEQQDKGQPMADDVL
jgi:hypothetical protein